MSQTENPAEPPATFPGLFAQVVADRPEHDALIHGEEILTYRDLDEQSSRLARAMLAGGAGKGTRVAILAPDSPLFLVAFYAALRIGALVTPISTLTTPRELAHIVATSDAQILIGTRRFLDHDYGRRLAAALPGIEACRPGQLQLPFAPYLRSVWFDDADGLPWAGSVTELRSRADGPDGPGAELLAAVEAQVAPGDDALVVYTSGSTAAPKAVVHRQWSVARQPPVLARYFDVRPEDRTLSLLPAFWMGGISAALQVLSTGGTLVYATGPDVQTVLDTVQRHGITNMVVWHLLARLRAAAEVRGIALDDIKITTGATRDLDGNPIPTRLQTRMLGMSESFAPHSAELVTTRLPESKAGAAGRAVNGIERRVVDPDTGAEVAPGEVGELQLRGGALMSGFYKVPREQVFTADGFFPTGDLVRIDADGYAFFVGRGSDMIKTNAANVSRIEVEAALNALPEVDVAVVTGLPDAERGELVAAAVVPAAGCRPTPENLREALRDSLSSFKIPRRIVFVTHQDIPRTATGKVRLFELGELVTAQPAEPSRPEPLSSITG